MESTRTSLTTLHLHRPVHLFLLVLLLVPCALSQDPFSYRLPPKSNIPGISALYPGDAPRGVSSALPKFPSFPADNDLRLTQYNPVFPSSSSSSYPPQNPPPKTQYPAPPQYFPAKTPQYPAPSGYNPPGQYGGTTSAGIYGSVRGLTPYQQDRLLRALGLVVSPSYPGKSGYGPAPAPAPSRDAYYPHDYPKTSRQTRGSFSGSSRYNPSPKFYAVSYPQGKLCHPNKNPKCPGTRQRCVCEDCSQKHYKKCFMYCC